jgi:hypothetical protein
VAKCASFYATRKLASYFNPHQLGVDTPGGCEAAVHATRRFIVTMPEDFVFVKLDFSNAFNTLQRDIVLEAVASKFPSCLSSATWLIHIIHSSTLVPTTFCCRRAPSNVTSSASFFSVCRFINYCVRLYLLSQLVISTTFLWVAQTTWSLVT